MKKILTITALAFAGQFTWAQDGANELKNFRFGLKVTPSVNWYTPEDKLMDSNGPTVKFGGGLILEFRLAKVASLQTGFQIDSEGGKIKYKNGGATANTSTMSYYYNIANDKIISYNPSNSYSTEITHYQLNERQFKATYITIPLMLKLKTKEIGSFTYFGQFGFNTSFRWKAYATDNVTVLSPLRIGETETLKKVDITDDMNFLKASLAFGFGAEMNLSGTTSLLFGLNYDLGFTYAAKKESGYIEKQTYTYGSNPEKMPQRLKSNAVILTIGVLF